MLTFEELIKEGKYSPHSHARYIYDYFVKREGDIVACYEIDRVNLVAMTLERDELDEKYKEAVRDRKEYKKLYDLQVKKNIQDIESGNEVMKDYKAALDTIKVLETKVQFLEPYKQLYEYYKARYEFEENPPEIEEIFVTSSSPEDVYAAFIDKDRAEWDAKESGTDLCSIKLYRGPKAIPYTPTWAIWLFGYLLSLLSE